ncbi:MAG: hypothetical protein PHY47_13400 [Lachnospiraceae bacterium]|nr:hypothetical protein [Lachnospiraceae bacterium]
MRADLYKTIKHTIQHNNELIIDRNFYGGLYENILLFLGVEQIIIEECQTEETEKTVEIDGITSIDGTIKISRGKIRILASDKIENLEERTLYFSIQLLGDYKTKEVFGNLAPFITVDGQEEESLFEQIYLMDPFLEFIDETWELSIHAFTRKPEDGKWNRYAWLLNSKMYVEGSFVPGTYYYPSLKMEFKTEHLISIPVFDSVENENFVIDTDDDPSRYRSRQATHAYMEYKGRLNGSEQTFSIYVPLFMDENVWQFSVYASPTLALTDIAIFLKDILNLPDNMMLMPQSAFLSSFGLQQMDIKYQPQTENSFENMQMKHIRGIFALGKPLEIFVPNLILNQFQLAWESSCWSSKDAVVSLFMAANASAKLGDLTLTGNITAYYPYMEFSGGLTLSKDSTLQDMAKECGVSLPDFWTSNADGTNEIAELDIQANAIQRNISVWFSVSDVLQLKINEQLSFQLESLSGEVSYGAGKMGFTLAGILTFRSKDQQNLFSMQMSTEYADGGWLFEGGLAHGEVDLGKFLYGVLEIDPASLDQAVAGVMLQDFRISYSTAEEELFLYASCAVWFDILGIRTTLGGRVRLFLGKEEKKAALLVYIDIESLRLRVLAQVDDFYAQKKEYIFRIELQNKYLQAVYEGDPEKSALLKITLGGMTLGDIVLAVIRLLNPNARNTLPAPWNVLNKIDLSNFVLTINMDDHTMTFTYNLDFNLAGILKIRSVGIAYDGKKIDYILSAEVLGQAQEITWDAINEEPPKDVLPDDRSFKLHYFGLGSHLNLELVGDTLAAMMEDMAKKLDPTSVTQQVSYSERNGWMIGADLELADLFRARVLLYDPLIYGISVTLNVKETDQPPLCDLVGFSVELYYKKISDETGMFHCCMTLPKKFRVINLGAVTLYPGEIMLEIYTNGSFYFDLGFPHNQDFSGSWGLAVGIYAGKGGVYFGIFKGDAVQSVPEITNGVFSPVVKIGIGLSFGLSRDFDIGIVKGGVSLMAVGMFEGVFAIFTENDEAGNNGKKRAVYYHAEAVVGVVGSLFICVDFKIIAVKASAMISAFCTIRLESCRRALLQVDLELQVKAYIKILFVKITFAFHFKQSVQFYLGSDSQTPWTLKETPQKRLYQGEMQTIVFGTARNEEEIVTISPYVMPLVSIRDTLRSENETTLYSMAFPVFLLKEDFRLLLERLATQIWDADEEFMTEGYAVSMLEGTLEESITYEKVLEFFQNHVQVNIGIKTDAAEQDEETPAVVFPMLPQLVLCANGKETDFGKPVVDGSYMEAVRSYFANTDADVIHMNSQTPQDESYLPICAVLLTDWIKMAVRELTGKVKGLFETIEVEGQSIEEIKRLYGISGETLLENNPQMSVTVSRIPEMKLTTTKGDTLEQLAKKTGVAPLWSAASGKYGLLTNSFDVTMDSYVFYPIAPLTWEQTAAMFYVRLYDVDVIYSRYVRHILELNLEGADGIADMDMTWVCDQAGERVIRLPGIGEWTSYAGDSIVRLAKMCAVLDPSYQDFQWEEFKTRLEMVESEGAKTGYRLHGIYRMGRFAGTFGELCCRLYPDFRDNPQDYPLWGQEILRPGMTLRVKDITVPKFQEGMKAENSLRQYGQDALIGGLRSGTAELSHRQWLSISKPQRIPFSVLRERLFSEESVDEIAAILSRAFMQGTKLLKPDEIEKGILIPMYQMTGQLMDLPEELTDYRLSLRSQEGTDWISPEMEEKIIAADEIRRWEFGRTVKEEWEIQQMSPFAEREQCYVIAEGWKTNLADTGRTYLGVLPEGAIDYIRKYSEMPEIYQKQTEKIDCVWTAAFSVRICKKEDGIYYVLGVKASETNRLFELMASKDLAAVLFYDNKGSGAETESLIPLTGEDITIIKTNLSKETRHLMKGAEKSYLARLSDGTEFIKLLWECTVIGGGYWLHLPKEAIANFVFDDEGFGEIILVAEVCDDTPDSVNSLYLPVAPIDITLHGSREKVLYPVLPAGCVGFTVDRKFDNENAYQNLFQMMAYTVEKLDGKKFESAPLLPTGDDDDGNARYDFVCPVWKMCGDSVYAGLGESVSFRLYTRDVLGNSDTLDECFTDGDTFIAKRQYNDFLIGLHELPGTTWTYYFIKDAEGKTAVRISAVLSQDRLPEGEELKMAADYAKTAGLQLGCEDVTIAASCSLGKFTLPENGKEIIQKYVSELSDYLLDSSKSVPGAAFDVAFEEKSDGRDTDAAVIPVELQLTISRNRDLAEEDVAAFAVTKLIPSEEVNFEKCWTEAELSYLLAYDNNDRPAAVSKKLFGLDAPDKKENLFRISPYTIWLSEQKEVKSPEFYALAPLSNELVSVSVGEYTFASQDANIWEKQLLEDMETFLSGTNVCKVLECVRQDGTEPEKLDGEDCLNKLIGIKEGIAAQLAGRLLAVRKGAEQAPAEVINLAKDRFSQSLAWAYDTGVIAVYEAVWKNQVDLGHYRLEPYVKSDACISATKPEVRSDGTTNSGLFCMFLREMEESVENIALSFPYLEYDIETGMEGYEKSKWLRLAIPLTENISLEQDIGVPFPKKECPMPPQLLGQNNLTDGQGVLEYRWSVEVSTSLFRQDMLYLRLEYGELTKGLLEEPDDKITALAQYQLERTKILNMLQDDTQILAAYNQFITYAESYAGKTKKLLKLPTLGDSGNSVLVKIGYSQGQEEVAILNLSDVAEHLGVEVENVVCMEEAQMDGNINIMVTICSLPVYKYYWMKPKAFLVRNENLFTEELAETDKNFIFYTETMELPQLYVFADYKNRSKLTETDFGGAIQAVLDKLQIAGYPVHLSMTVYYEYPMLPGSEDVIARLPITFFPYFKNLEEIQVLIEKSVFPNNEGGKIILDTNVYKDGTDIKILHAGFECLFDKSDR